jgi:hypothetical protein
LRPFTTSFLAMSPSEADKDEAKKSSNCPSQEVEGQHNEWKFRAPYKVHSNDPDFKPLYEGSCHCGRIQYQLSREKPLDAKFCHCTTCQVLHGVCSFLFSSPSLSIPQFLSKSRYPDENNECGADAP